MNFEIESQVFLKNRLTVRLSGGKLLLLKTPVRARAVCRVFLLANI